VIASLVYLLCAATSILCAFLLARGYRRSGASLLLWSTVCFVGLALDNSLLFVDRVVFPDQTMFALRRLFSLLGMVVLLYGLIWEAD
jgi:hypothetical protein